MLRTCKPCRTVNDPHVVSYVQSKLLHYFNYIVLFILKLLFTVWSTGYYISSICLAIIAIPLSVCKPELMLLSQ